MLHRQHLNIPGLHQNSGMVMGKDSRVFTKICMVPVQAGMLGSRCPSLHRCAERTFRRRQGLNLVSDGPTIRPPMISYISNNLRCVHSEMDKIAAASIAAAKASFVSIPMYRAVVWISETYIRIQKPRGGSDDSD